MRIADRHRVSTPTKAANAGAPAGSVVASVLRCGACAFCCVRCIGYLRPFGIKNPSSCQLGLRIQNSPGTGADGSADCDDCGRL
ncbi:hypothetical protein V5799_010049 [Amblyomma americanum]|uniref:Uncharacterized protein n=1 Tax=Amblyomma americanum TaxID=6943 RepID=A0AAQ4F8R1_AMBAM